MSYLVLARKYRPKAFSEVAGQDVVTRTLRGAIAEERVGHAYLFFGPRGTGKTTSARLFAKALNCETGPTDDPCGTCERCVSYDAGTEPDLIEIDAASNTGVDHVRSLRDQAGYVPLKARFKVFLIDEVHMLSKAAFNALLKTLEEPPPHVKFLFATTELHKVPDTVVSRCQVLRLSPLSEEQIRGRLNEVFELEGIQAEEGVAAEIARRARGGMRDALSLADQLLALVGREPKVADTERLAGEGSAEAIEAVLDAVLAGDKPRLLGALPAREGDEPAFLDATLDYLRSAMLLRLVGEDAPMLAETASPAARTRMAERASAFGADRLELVLQELLHARERMGPIHMRAHARLVLETTLLDLCRPEATMPINELIRRLEALEGRATGAAHDPGMAPPGPPADARTGGGGSQPAPSPSGAAGPKAPTAAAPMPEAAAPVAVAAAPKAPPAAPAGGPSSAGNGPVPIEELRSAPVQAAPAPGPAPRTALGAAAQVPPEPKGGRKPASVAPRVQTNSTHDQWEGFLAELGKRSEELAAVAAKKAQLVRSAGGVAPMKFRGLSAEEQKRLESPAGRRAIEEAFRATSGDGVRLKLEIHDASTGSAAGDPFTEHIRLLFNGRIEG